MLHRVAPKNIWTLKSHFYEYLNFIAFDTIYQIKWLQQRYAAIAFFRTNLSEQLFVISSLHRCPGINMFHKV